jgi:hypothetical protein
MNNKKMGLNFNRKKPSEDKIQKKTNYREQNKLQLKEL